MTGQTHRLKITSPRKAAAFPLNALKRKACALREDAVAGFARFVKFPSRLVVSAHEPGAEPESSRLAPTTILRLKRSRFRLAFC